MSQYLEFLKLISNKKTETVMIIAKRSGVPLGFIRWHCPWRQYCFFPQPETIWSEGCLGEVKQFIGQLSEERCQRRKTKDLNVNAAAN